MADGTDYSKMAFKYRRRADRLAAENAALKAEKAKLAQDQERYLAAITKLDQKLKTLESQPALNPEQIELYNEMIAEKVWNEDISAFQSAMEDVLMPGVDLKAVLMAVGYDPASVPDSGLSLEMIQHYYEQAADKFPQLFNDGSASEGQESPEEAETAEVEEPNKVDSFQQAFEIGATLPQSQAGAQLHGGIGGTPLMQQQQPQAQPPQAQAQQTSNGFKGFGAVSGRGGPPPTKVQTVGAHLRDPAWIYANQSALADAANKGIQVVDLDRSK
jgi:hypothetical protein